MEFWILIAYILVGPIAWGFFTFTIYLGRKRMKLLNPTRPIPNPAPSVTVLVPAKDEGLRIRGCLESILNQNYPHFDLIAINDRSVDDTGKVMDDLAAANPKMRVLHIQEGSLQPGWTGKNNALFQGAKMAQGDWFCFVDSDVVLDPQALHQTVAVAEAKRYDLITLLPRLESHTVWESSVVPLAAAAASAMYLIALTNANHLKNIAFANGQYLMIRKGVYYAFGGHETVKDRYCEDVQIAEILKRSGFRPRVSWGNDVAAVRMYSSFQQIVKGWSRIYYAARVGKPWRTLAAMTFLIVCVMTWFIALGFALFGKDPSPISNSTWLLVFLIHTASILLGFGTIYHWSGNRVSNALLFPFTVPILLYIMGKSVIMCITKKVEWRGTSYQHQMAAKLPDVKENVGSSN